MLSTRYISRFFPAQISALTCGLLLASAAQAATITVNLSSDVLFPGGGCTLRGAIGAINAGINSNGCTATGSYGVNDKIVFSLPTTAPIVFTKEIMITKNMVIDGSSAGQSEPGAPGVVLDGNKVTRLLNAANASLTLSNLTLQNGNAGNNYGGAVYTNNAANPLVIRNSAFINNNSNGYGGAIYGSGTITIESSKLNGNTSPYNYGGAVFANNTISVSNSIFNSNTAPNSYGGAIYAKNVVTVNGGSFAGNSARYHGGAIYAENASIINNSLFESNTVPGNEGGAIHSRGPISIDHSLFTGNSATGFGGAVYAYGTLSAINSSFTGNSSTNWSGGALYAVNKATISRSTFASNRAIWGGAIHTEQTIAVDNSTFLGNTARNDGGAIKTFSVLSASYLTLVNNVATYGAALYFGSNGDLKNSIIVGDASVTTAQCYGYPRGGTNLEWRQGFGNGDNSCKSTHPVTVAGNTTVPQIVSITLEDNGGPTQTLTLPAGSPAIDVGDVAVVTNTDQRGERRVVGDAPDLGAVEFVTVTPPPPTHYTHAIVTTQTVGGVPMKQIDGEIAPDAADVGKHGALFVFANLAGTNNWLLLNPFTGWHPWVDCNSSSYPYYTYYTSPLPSYVDFSVFPMSDLSAFTGSGIFFGYGIGTDDVSACNEMFSHGRYAYMTSI